MSDIIRENTEESYSQIIDLIFKDAQRSIADLDSSISILNTKLSAVTGFGAIFVKFIGDLPGKSFDCITSTSSYLLPCYTCLCFKIVALMLLMLSILISLRALLPKKGGGDLIITPTEQVEKCLELSPDEYKLLFISKYEQAIESLVKLRDWKSNRLNWSGEILVFAAVLSALDLLLKALLE